MYCKNEKATIQYKFADGAERLYQTDKTPITINTYTKTYAAIASEADVYSPEGFWLTFYSPNNRNWIDGPFHAYKVYYSEDYSFGPNYEGIALWNCGSNDWQARGSDGVPYGPGVDITTIRVDYSRKCPIASQAKNRCAIEIKYNNIVIFVDQGDCPCTFTVQCGDCPEGTVRCDSPGYPGYCCIPCADLCSKISTIGKNLL